MEVSEREKAMKWILLGAEDEEEGGKEKKSS